MIKSHISGLLQLTKQQPWLLYKVSFVRIAIDVCVSCVICRDTAAPKQTVIIIVKDFNADYSLWAEVERESLPIRTRKRIMQKFGGLTANQTTLLFVW